MRGCRSRVPSGRCHSSRRSAGCSTSSANDIRVTRSRRGGEVHPELDALLALQEKDQAVMATDDALAALEPAERELDEAQVAAERALAAAQAGIQAALGRRDELEGKIANYRTMQEQRRQRPRGGGGAEGSPTAGGRVRCAGPGVGQGEGRVQPPGGRGAGAE